MLESSLKIFVINLERRPDRWQYVRDQLLQFGLEFERMAAHDEKAAAQLPAMADPITVTTGEIACHLSHRACWRSLVDSGVSYGLILEDDVVISRRVEGFLKSLDTFPKNADIVRLETRCNAVEVYGREKDNGGSTSIYRLAERTNGAAAYVMTRNCAMRLLNHDMATEIPVDDLLFDPNGPLAGTITAYQVIPGLCVQGDVLFNGAVPSMLKSDLETERRIRFNQAKILRRSSLNQPQKILRETRRIGRQAWYLPRWAYRHLIQGIRILPVPFADHGRQSPEIHPRFADVAKDGQASGEPSAPKARAAMPLSNSGKRR